MDQPKIGELIRRSRMRQGLTQRQLADCLQVSDQAVSKWERGLGAPDVSLLTRLAEALGLNVESLLAGELPANPVVSGNLKKLNFYVCPDCGNLLMAMDDAQISCCGKKLTPRPLQKADEAHALTVEPVEQEWFLTTSHPMRREHSIAFAAFLSGDTLVLRKRYPEWGLDTRLPMLGHGLLLWYCTRHGLFYQTV